MTEQAREKVELDRTIVDIKLLLVDRTDLGACLACAQNLMLDGASQHDALIAVRNALRSGVSPDGLNVALGLGKRKIWKTSTDCFSAETLRHAKELRAKSYGWQVGGDDCENDPFEDSPLPDDQMLGVLFSDGTTKDEGGGPYPDWVPKESDARVEWVNGIARVHAPAHVWAKRTEGMVCSTEF